VLSPSSAQACSFWCGPQIPNRPTIPVNGGITASYQCGRLCDDSECIGADDPRLLVTDAAFQKVPGTTHVTPYGDGRSFALTWVSDEPLTAGQVLLASPRHDLSGDHIEYHDEITVVEAMPDEPVFGDVTVELAHVERWVGEQYCCDLSGICSERCIARQKRGAVELSYQGRPDYQFLFRASPSPGDPGDWVAEYLGGRLEIEQQQDEYCVTIEALRLVDGTTWSVTEVCLPHGSLPDLEVRDTTQGEIDQFWSEASCDDHGFPIPPTEPPVGSPDAGRVDDGEPVGTAGSTGSGPQRRASDGDSGCHFVVASGTSPHWIALAGLVGIAIAARRRRRHESDVALRRGACGRPRWRSFRRSPSRLPLEPRRLS
jgi:MYXO-CTERM domain-containing protein